MEAFDIKKFDEYREDNRLEVKKAKDGLPISLWESYSAMANCYGGVIILGVAERKDGSFYTTGLQDATKLKKMLWDTINNRGKVNFNLLLDEDVKTYELNGDVIMVIYVPRARRDQKPVYINNDIRSLRLGPCYSTVISQLSKRCKTGTCMGTCIKRGIS